MERDRQNGISFQAPRKISLTVLVILLLAGSLRLSSPGFANPSPIDAVASKTVQTASNSQTDSETVYLPYVSNGHTNRLFPTLLLGVYPQGYIGLQSVVDAQLHGLNAWVNPGTSLSLAGTFIDFQEPNPAVDIPSQLESLWSNGYTGFVNIHSTRNAVQIASGYIDGGIISFADAFKSWVDQGEGRFAFLAPLPEMNGDWVTYGLNPTAFKAAYARIQQIFTQRGVPENAVRWVFAPNGWTPPGQPPLTSYYPGDEVVDIIGFSGYNFGFHYEIQKQANFRCVLQT